MEIETLQTKSAALNARLENRKKVERLLGPAVEEVSIAPAVVQCISIGQMDDNWLKALAELQKRLKAIETKANGSENIKAMTDIRPLLEGLTSKVYLSQERLHYRAHRTYRPQREYVIT